MDAVQDRVRQILGILQVPIGYRFQGDVPSKPIRIFLCGQIPPTAISLA